MNEPNPERWLPVVDYEGLYDVSDYGRIRSLPHMTAAGMRGGQMLNPWIGDAGRLEVKLWKQNVGKTRRVSQLVAEAFIGPRPPGMECRHLDDVQSNNRPSNLAYGTSHDNKMDMVRNARHYEANKTRCDRGHEFTPENTHLRRDRPGHRECKACHAEDSAERRIAMAESGPRCINGCDAHAIALGLCVKCYTRQHSAAQRPDDWDLRTCPWCGETFQLPMTNGRGMRKYCSDKCARKAKSAKERERQRQKRLSK